MNDLQVILTEEMALPSVADALPKDFNKARFIQNTMALFNEKPELLEFPREKLIPGVLKAAYLGLDFMMGECYLIPYGNQIKFSIDYKGKIKLAKKYSVKPISEIEAHLIREGDEYKVEMRDNQNYITYIPKPLNDGEIRGAFAICRFKDGTIIYEEMTKRQLDTAKRLSKAQTGIPWKMFDDMMYKKTVINRLFNRITLDNDAYHNILMDDKIIDDNPPEIIQEEENPFT